MDAIKVLDHGYVRFIEAYGHGDAGLDPNGSNLSELQDYECGIIETARQSTQGSFRGWEEDERLLRFLYSNKPPHATPFEFAGLIIEVQAPIFIFREWHRHRTQSYNEMSARYAPLPDLNYVPTKARCFLTSTKNKQAGTVKGAEDLTDDYAEEFIRELQFMYERQEEFYQKWLGRGVPKELARIELPVGRYSKMRANANLRNWLAFITLRADPGAMWEIQQFADAIGVILESKFPRTWKLYVAGRNPSTPSGKGVV